MTCQGCIKECDQRGGAKQRFMFLEEVMTVTTHTIEIPSVESEWVVIGGVGRLHGVCIEQCVRRA